MSEDVPMHADEEDEDEEPEKNHIDRLLNSLLIQALEAAGPTQAKKIIKLLSLYVTNILENPNEPEFRTVKRENQTFAKLIAPFPTAVQFLQASGFENGLAFDDSPALVCPDLIPFNLLQISRKVLEQYSSVPIPVNEAKSEALPGSANISSSETMGKSTRTLSRKKIEIHSKFKIANKSAPFVGLVNQGATCYLNSYLQTLFHNHLFREVLFSIPADTEVESVESILNALQELCIGVHSKSASCRTNMLTKAFGWTAQDVFLQHDVQELSRILCERIEKKCQLKRCAKSLSNIYAGSVRNFIRCLDIPYLSEGLEDFWDISLNVNEISSLEESLKQYFTPELLDQDNRYRPTEELGLQRAEKGLIIAKFPVVLQLHLKRFDFDPWTLRRKKVNTHFSFSKTLDLSMYSEKKSDESSTSNYDLFAVLVHSGGASGGHYFAFLDTQLGWVRFDDERVTFSSWDEVLESGLGGSQNSTSAYMLVYIVHESFFKAQRAFGEEEVSSQLKVTPQYNSLLIFRFQDQLQEASKLRDEMRKRELDALLALNIHIATEDNLSAELEMFSKDIFLFSKLSCFQVFPAKRNDTFLSLRPRVHEFTQISSERTSFWVFDGEKLVIVKSGMEKLSLLDILGSTSTRILALNNDSIIKINPEQTLSFDTLLLVRLFSPPLDPMNQNPISYFGIFLVSSFQTCDALITAVKERLDISHPLPIYFLRNDVLCQLSPSLKFKDQGIISGSVLCASMEQRIANEELPFPSFPGWFEYVSNRVQVHLCSLDGDLSKSGFLELSLSMRFSEVVAVISSFLRISPDFFILVGHDPIRDIPKARPFLDHEVSSMTLKEMLTTMSQSTNKLFYNLKQDVKFSLKKLSILWYDAHVKLKEKFEIELPFESTILDLKKKISPLKGIDPNTVRLIYVRQALINTIYPNEFKIVSLPTSLNGDPMPLRAEQCSLEDIESKEGQLIRVCHYTKGDIGKQLSFFGDPFLFFAKENSTIQDFKSHLVSKLSMRISEVSNCKIAILKQGKIPRYLKDDQPILHHAATSYHPKFQEDDHLGIEHAHAPTSHLLNTKDDTMSRSSRESGISIRDV